MTREEIVKITNEFLVEEIEVDQSAINDNASFKDDLGIDSLDFVDIVVIVEKKFGFKIKAEEMSGVTTLGAFYDYIESKMNNR
ncbi:MAG: acyl carrier protein [Bacteroidales bacterium]|nr:acyl carrier protein [Bacteroidales bacterium]